MKEKKDKNIELYSNDLLINTMYETLFRYIDYYTETGNITKLRSLWEFLRHLSKGTRAYDNIDKEVFQSGDIHKAYLFMIADIGLMFRELEILPVTRRKRKLELDKLI